MFVVLGNEDFLVEAFRLISTTFKEVFVLRKFLYLLPTWFFPFVIQAQLQDSHFYKVDMSEISSDFKLHSVWKAHIEGSALRNNESRERLMKVKLYGQFDLELTSSLTAEFEPYLVITEGEIQSRFTRPESVIEMRHGFLRWNPVEGASFQLGSIDQSYLDAPLLVSNRSFLSSLMGYLHMKDNYEVQSIFQMSMPSVVNTFKRYSEIVDTPYFTSLFVYGEWLPSHYSSFRGHITGFHFSHLPAFMAHQSKLYGNTVKGVGSSARFAHPYYGVNFDVSSQLRITGNTYISIGYNGLFNMGAPFDRAWGERIYAVLDINAGSWTKIYSRIEYFHNNSDTAPAYFNSEVYGHNDRKGVLVELKAFLPKGNFELGARYVRSEPVQEAIIGSALGSRQNSFQVFVSSRYLAL